MTSILINNNPTKEFYEGLGKSNLSFPQALGELIDNSISAIKRTRIKIEIIIFKISENEYTIAVADNGKGIERDELINRVFKPGGKPEIEERGQFNEHGFGLKNALCWFTGNQEPFVIMTSTTNNDRVDLVEGPFQQKMYVQEVLREEYWNEFHNQELPESMNFKEINDKFGTRIYLKPTKGSLVQRI